MSKSASAHAAGAVLAVLAMSSTACNVGPKYRTPAVPVPPQFTEQPPQAFTESKDWKTAAPAASWAKGRWWEVFGDPELNKLEEQIDIQNQTLKSAEARFRQARALVAERRSDRLPTISAGASITHERFSLNRPVPVPPSETASADFNLGFQASWEPDLWGRIHNQIATAVENAQATAADLENARLSLHAELAVDYFDLRSLDQERRILEGAVAAYQRAWELTENRYRGGAANRAEVAEARTQLEAAGAQAVDVTDLRAQYQHAIAVLAGRPPEELAVPQSTRIFTLPTIPPGLPSALLERRPDIAAAERRVAAANSEVGLARAAFYPQVMLAAAVGLEGSSITNWLNWPSRLWAVGPSAVQTVFDASRRRAALRESIATYDAAVADYRQTVLTAFQQVEDNLSSLRILEDEAARQRRTVESARESEELSLNRYKGGLVTYLEVVTAQTIRLQNERTSVDIDRRRLESSVLLIRTLGGGWDGRSMPSASVLISSQD
ncbi:MAG TPA: efflux transporter outer membrane subunit [Verrucomicrobiae bacterium]|nr:efflux transporter outer membrane subunit [Verrucomicrobiae bacterium]